MNKQDAITTYLDTNESSAVRLQAMFTLMNIADEECLTTLFNVLHNDPCELIRHETAYALGEIPDERCTVELKKACTQDQSPVVKHECLVSLGTIGNPQEKAFLESFKDHEVYMVSASAKVGLERLEQTQTYDNLSVNELISALHSTSKRNEKIQLLFKLMTTQQDTAADAIYEILINDPCEIVRHEAGFCLGEFTSDYALDLLIKGTNKQTAPIALHECLFALGTTGNRKALECINSYLDHEEYVVRESAQIAKDRIEIIKNPYNGQTHA